MLEVYDDVMEIMGGDATRILPAHDPGTWARHPSRDVAPGLALAEVHLAAGERSRLEAPG